jgi:cytochrome b561
MQMYPSPGQPGGGERSFVSPQLGDIVQTPPGAQRPPFDSVTIGLHWATVVLVLALFATAWLHAAAEEQGNRLTPLLLQMHRSLGVIVWTITVLRFAWRMTGARLPPFPAHMATTHRAMVKLSEYGLYALLIGEPLTGLFSTLFSGRPFALLMWQVPPLLPRDIAIRMALHTAHEFGAWMLAIAVAGHAGAALFHHFVLRDDVLACMAPGVAALPRRKEASVPGTKAARTRSWL